MMVRRQARIILMPVLTLLITTLWVGNVFSQSGRPVHYNFQIKQSPASSPDSALVKFFVTVPFASLVFVHNNVGFVCGFNFNLFVKDNDGVVIYEKSWREKINTKSYRQTNSDSLYLHLTNQSTFKSGKYEIIVEAIDQNVGFSTFDELDLTIKDQSGKALVLGDILDVNGLVNEKSDFSKLELITENSIRNDFSLICEAVEVNNSQWTGEVIWVENGEEKRRDSLDILKSGDMIQIYRSYTIEDAPQGRFSVYFYLEGNGQIFETTEIELEIFKLVSFMSEENLEIAIEQMEYIGEGTIYDSLTSVTSLDQKKYWFDKFWNDNYPSNDSLHNPIKEEYYRRIRYANRSFGAGFEGWKTDRGHTYTIYGPPDQIERRVNNRMWRYEIWAYNSLKRQFVFVDEYGTGSYRLIRGY